MSVFSMSGVGGVECVTMPLNEATKKTIDKDYDSAKGKAVALTGNNTVGYGAADAPLFGVLRKVEHDGFATVQVKGFAVGLTSGADASAINKYAAVDGTGGVKSAGDGVVSNGYITAVEDDGTVTILM